MNSKWNMRQQSHKTGLVFHITQISVQPAYSLVERLTETRIDKYLDCERARLGYQYELKKASQIFRLLYTLILLLASGLAIWYLLPRDRELLITILKALFILESSIVTGNRTDLDRGS